MGISIAFRLHVISIRFLGNLDGDICSCELIDVAWWSFTDSGLQAFDLFSMPYSLDQE